MLEEHLGYLTDRVRLEAFAAAVARVVRAGDLVADLGCGTGILGLICLRAGASRVWAIEATSMIEVARSSLARAGLADRAEFIHGHSHRVELPDRVDIVICDHVGFFGFDYGIVQTLRDAQQRFLKPSGRLVPSRLRLQLGAIESGDCWGKVEAWSGSGVPAEFQWLRDYAVNTKYASRIRSEDLLGPAATLGEIQLGEEHSGLLTWTAEMIVERAGVLHGLGGWFDCELAPGIWMTNSPLSHGAIERCQAFLPIAEPVPVKSGYVVKATVMARPGDDLLAWIVEVPDVGKRFQQSTWQGMLWTPGDVSRARPERVPVLSREGSARMTVLRYCDGLRTARDIEQAVLRDHPDLFPSRDETARFVDHVLGRDTL